MTPSYSFERKMENKWLRVYGALGFPQHSPLQGLFSHIDPTVWIDATQLVQATSPTDENDCQRIARVLPLLYFERYSTSTSSTLMF